MLEGIQTNFEKLIALYENEKQQRESLEARFKQSQEDIDAYRKQNAELERQIDNLNLAQAFLAGGDSSAAKEKITRIIKEIDKCISLLEK